MKISSIVLSISSIALLAACAKHTHEIQAQYVSPMQYSSYDCQQIEQEMARLTGRISELGGKVESDADADDVQMGVGLILLWPTLFFLDGDTPQAQEYARLTGEFDALEKAGIQKNCSIQVERPVTKPVPSEAAQADKQKADYPSQRRR